MSWSTPRRPPIRPFELEEQVDCFRRRTAALSPGQGSGYLASQAASNELDIIDGRASATKASRRPSGSRADAYLLTRARPSWRYW